MDAFALGQKLIHDYSQYVKSFLRIRDQRISKFVESHLDGGMLWPEALIQLSPSYAPGPTVTDLAKDHLLHPLCAKIFSLPDHPGHSRPLQLHRHQYDALMAASRGEHYVLTTGTGSGKSLTYFVPIIDWVLKNQPEERKVRALVVYPLNALINSQSQALEDFFKNVPDLPVRFARYTGQETEAEKSRIREDPPHILLTNYVMLELILTRPEERMFVERTLSNIHFLVLDELHTYRGRQGADIAMLVRRLRERCGNPNLLCIGTSATLAVKGTRELRKAAAAEVASKIFGAQVKPENVIDETLQRAIPLPEEMTPQHLSQGLQQDFRKVTSFEELASNPLASWVEKTFGLEEEADETGNPFLVRRQPITLHEGAERLAEETGASIKLCTERLQESFQAGSRILTPHKAPAFAFKLHQFISQGGSVYATLEDRERRYLAIQGQYYAPADVSEATRKIEDGKRLLFPLLFCRECGQEYYLVELSQEGKALSLRPRPPASSEEEEGGERGYLLLDDDRDPIWTEQSEEDLPDEWYEFRKNGPKIKPEYRKFLPRRLYITKDGSVLSAKQEGAPFSAQREEASLCWFIPFPFLTCLCCGALYTKKENEFSKLTRLSSEGRSTATTLLSISTLRRMHEEGALSDEARKILSFTDNRQDASLQSGHFNDFVAVALLRAAIYQALSSLPHGQPLNHSNISEKVLQALDLAQAEYAKEVGEFGPLPRLNREALKEYLEYRIYEDLRRGWRIIHPNLEQCGLLKLDYLELKELCMSNEPWKRHPLLSGSPPELREKNIRAILNFMRKRLAIDAYVLNPQRQEEIRRRVLQALKEPWCFDDDEKRLREGVRFILPGGSSPGWNEHSLGARSSIGRFLRRPDTWTHLLKKPLSEKEYEEFLEEILKILASAGYLIHVASESGKGVQIRANALLWRVGDGKEVEDDPVQRRKIETPRATEIRRQVNAFFRDFYKQTARDLKKFKGAEHTGQVSKENREQREEEFRQATISCLFCSPTMELGIDIRDLNLVHLRNVPPSPANYSQRSGRAGRSGQPALVVTYCAVGSGHDQYFFNQPVRMVSGAVSPQRLDLGNEELIRSHIHAIWLAKTGLRLGRSLTEILDTGNPEETFPLLEDVKGQIELSPARMKECLEECKAVLFTALEDLQRSCWYSEEWLENTLRNAAKEFDRSCNRWCEMFLAADRQLQAARKTIDDSHKRRIPREEVTEAEQREREAKRQKDLLCNNTQKDDSDFYPYRYFANEGFLPGYNFPRLPIRAYVPTGSQEGEFLSRPRFLALTEYGPGNIIYHEGRKYKVTKSLLPPGSADERFVRAKLCLECGYYHARDSATVDCCENCGVQLTPDNSEYIARLFSMTTVTTRRIDRITCDEEERRREGFQVTTHFRFARDANRIRIAKAIVKKGGSGLLELTYAPSASLWRINHKWRRSHEKGFRFDPSGGNWGKDPTSQEDNQIERTSESLQAGVRIFVEDTRNLLLITPSSQIPMDDSTLASFQHALQRGIAATYQVEDTELASERIGMGATRSLLFWESAEGGVGVLSRLLHEPDAMARVAREALQTCHFHPETGEEVQASEEPCIQACYQCLLTYTNQPDHPSLDRHQIKDILLSLSRSSTLKGQGARNYEQQYEWLRRLTDTRSELERRLLDHLYETKRNLPDHAQKYLQDYYACPDFFYDDFHGAIFCNGNVHDTPEQQRKDQKIYRDLKELGYRVVVIWYNQDLEGQMAQHKDIFGERKP